MGEPESNRNRASTKTWRPTVELSPKEIPARGVFGQSRIPTRRFTIQAAQAASLSIIFWQ